MSVLKEPKMLVFDIETSPLQAYLWQPGKQVVRHGQLLPGQNMWEIICITYAWVHGGPVGCIKWTPERGTAGVVEDFDALASTADICIGKNNKSFDNKQINSARMFANLPARPEWIKYTADLEQQMRRYFRLPSQSLDYISHKLGLGGKRKMEFQDWIDISQWMVCQKILAGEDMRPDHLDKMLKVLYNKTNEEVIKTGEKAFNKMCTYGKKDSADTRTLWKYLSKHFEPIYNKAVFNSIEDGCVSCGNNDLCKDGFGITKVGKYQVYKCKSCGYKGNRKLVSLHRMG